MSAFAAGILLTSCSGDQSLSGKPVNMNAGSRRDNNYIAYGTFTSTGSGYIGKFAAGDTSGAIVRPLVMDIDKIAFATRNGSINVSLGDDTLWTVKLPDSTYIVAGMCADNGQNLYAIGNNGTVYSYSSGGRLRWKFFFSDVADTSLVLFSDLLSLSDGIIAASSLGIAAKIDTNGKQVWKRSFTGSIPSLFPADEDDNVYIPVTFDTFGGTDSIYCIDKNGITKWAAALRNSRIIKAPARDDENLYIPIIEGSGDGKIPKIAAFSNSGRQIWQAVLQYSPRYISAGGENEVIVVNYDMSYGKPYSIITCLDSKGKKLWEKSVDLTIRSPFMISKNCYAFVGVRDNTAAVFYYRRGDEVVLFRDYQMPDSPSTDLTPVVLPGAILAFAGSDEYLIYRIDNSKLEKLFPW